jgi:hypothetical protein
VRNAKTRKPTDPTPSANGEPAPGDARKLERSGDATIEPAKREQAPAKPANRFSREAQRLDQNYAAALGLKDHIHTVTVDKPPSESWFRVHPDRNDQGDEMFFDTKLLCLKNGPDRGTYQVDPDLWPLLEGEKTFKPFRLVLCIDRQGQVYLWPLRLPGDTGREDDWMTSALSIAEQAKTEWVRMVAGPRDFKSKTSGAVLSDPVWPEQTFDELLELAFRKRRIVSETDPILRRLREGV